MGQLFFFSNAEWVTNFYLDHLDQSWALCLVAC